MPTANPESNSPAKRHVTLSDIARELGLSKRAVSQALRERPGTVRISKETQERVRKLADQLGYRQNPAARALFTGRSGTFGVLSFHSHMHGVQIRVATATDEFRKHGQVPMLVHAWVGDGDPCLRNVHLLIDARVNGILLLGGQAIVQKYADEIRNYGIPLAAIASHPIEGVTTFGVKRAQGFRLITEHLIGRGYRRLTAIIRTQSIALNHPLPAEEALEGIHKAIKSARASGHNISLEEVDMARDIENHMLDFVPGLHALHADGYLAMWRLIEKGNLPDAVIFQIDGSAMGAMRACAEAGIRVPEDIAITGYGNDPAATASTTPLTTIEEPDVQLCELAVRHIIGAAEGAKDLVPSTILPGKLIVRRSSSREWGNLPKDLFALEIATRKRG